MINFLSAKNYKSFDELSFEIGNINILLGTNSCGKSSVTKLLLMLSQTADMVSSYDSILRLNGDKSSLGEAINIFQDKDNSKKIKFGWGLSFESTRKGHQMLYLHNLLDEIDGYFRIFYMTAVRSKRLNISEYQKRMILLDETFDTTIMNNSHPIDVDSANKIKASVNKILASSSKIRSYVKNDSERYKVELISPPRLEELVQLLSTLDFSDLCPTYIEYTIGYNELRDECELKELSISNKINQIVLRLNISRTRKIELYSDIICKDTLERSRLDIIRGIDVKNISLLDESFTVNCKNPFARFIRAYISYTLSTFTNSISGNRLNHVSPLRAFPQRYYLLEKSAQHNELNSNDGSQLAEILKNNQSILARVNEYFDEFGIKISTAKTNDIIHRITVKQNNVTVELTDVGFGISQVLPILVQALISPENSLTIIEQPEIHLHPKMQAWLTTALVSISIKDNKKFIIETHSDTIIQRLQILLLDPDVEFTSENLNIYHLERGALGKTSFKKVPLNQIGEITWPKGFMDMEIQSAIKLQKLKIQKLKEISEAGNAGL